MSELLEHAEAMLAAAIARMDPLGITPPELRLELEQWGREVARLRRVEDPEVAAADRADADRDVDNAEQDRADAERGHGTESVAEQNPGWRSW